jgi:pimeloyl-ACP methyl ester carboxylesterase
MAEARVNGARIWYELRGEGPPLVQIGGAISGHEGYAEVTDRMAERFTVLDYDHRGYGHSDRPDQRYDADVWSDDLAALLTAAGIERCHVHGGSMGGFIAARFATRYPERIERLVIGGAVARSDRMGRTQFEVWKLIARAYGVASEELALELTTKAFSRNYLSTLGDDLLRDIREVTERNVELPVFLDACDTMIQTDVSPLLGSITAPTLVMVGSEDCLTPLDAGPDGVGARAMAEAIPGATLHVLEGCGHGNLIEQPEESIAAIFAFLGARP